MFPYWILFSIFAAGSFGKLRDRRFSPLTAPVFFAALLAAVLFIGLRYEVGGDWDPYIGIYRAAGLTDFWALAADPGYSFINKISHAFGAEIWLSNLICAALFMWGLYRFAEDQPNPWLAILVAVPYLIIVVAMGYVRQAVAIGFLMAAISAFHHRRIVFFGVCVVIAVLFHKTAVVALPLIVLSTRRNRVPIYLAFAVLGAVLFASFLNVVLDTLVRNYIDSGMKSDGAGIRIAMNLIPALIYLPFQKRFATSPQEQAMWRNFALASVAITGGLFFSSASTVIDRIALYLIPVQIFVLSRLPLAFSSTGKPRGDLTAAVVVYSATVQFVWLNYASNAEFWIPYRVW